MNQTKEAKEWKLLTVRMMTTEIDFIKKASSNECRSMSSWIRHLVKKEYEKNK